MKCQISLDKVAAGLEWNAAPPAHAPRRSPSAPA